MKGYYGCMGLVEASEKGVIGHSNNEPELRIHEHQGKYLNVDTTKKEGAFRAAKLHLAESGLADIVFTPFRFATSILFTPSHRGRMFTLLRHPVERATSLFYYRQIATWEERPGVYRPDLEGVDIGAWIARGEFQEDHVDYIYGHYVVSNLVGKGPMDALTEEDLQQAKDILKTKFVVGLTSQMEESVGRFDYYFGWNDRERENCYQEYILQGLNKNMHKPVVEGSDAWNALEDMAYFDMQLYEYAVELFEEQGREIFHDVVVEGGAMGEEEDNSRRAEKDDSET